MVIDSALGFLTEPINMSNGEVTVDSFIGKLTSGESKLVIATEGVDIVLAFTMEIRVFESGKRSLVLPLIGGNIVEVGDQFMPYVEKMARNNNCIDIIGYAVRPGWLRLLKTYRWHKTYDAIHYTLGE